MVIAGAHPIDAGDITDPLHAECPEPVRWSRVNLAELMQGVPTPLSWDYWRHVSERAGRRIYHRIGLASRAELEPPDDPSRRTTSIFHGWPVANVDALRGFIDRAAGNAGDSFEHRLLGEAKLPPAPPRRVRKRPIVSTVKTLWVLRRYPGELARATREVDAWWRDIVRKAAVADLEACRRLLDEAFDRSVAISVVAGVGTLGGQIFVARLEHALPGRFHADLPSIVSGDGVLAELELAEALRDVAHGRRSLDSFLADFGFHGPAMGECMNRSWREDPSQLDATLKGFASEPDGDSPRARHDRRKAQVRESLRRLEEAIPAWRRPGLRRRIGVVGRFVVWREEGKALSLKGYDAVRAVVRRIGWLLTETGAIDQADDAFFLTREELLHAPSAEFRETVLWRRARRLHYQSLEIADSFAGPPAVRRRKAGAEPMPAGAERDAAEVRGLGVSPGIAEGIARVVLDVRECERFERGDILVCAATDPSWVGLLAQAGGVVTDIGSMLSHGAVIARELAVPCVVNTRSGTRSIADGSRVRIDGSTGEITVVS